VCTILVTLLYEFSAAIERGIGALGSAAATLSRSRERY